MWLTPGLLTEYRFLLPRFFICTKPENETDKYAIRYADFVMPLINAIKEQQQQIDELKLLIYKLKDNGSTNKN